MDLPRLTLRTLPLFAVLAASCAGLADPEPGLRAYERHEYELALAEWTPLAREGDADSQFFVATMYEDGRGVRPDAVEAQEWYQRAASQGHAHAQLNLGLMYLEGRGVQQSYPKAHAWFTEAARGGLAAAHNNLGVLYLKGLGVEEDHARARRHFERAARDGEARSQRILASMATTGAGGGRDEVAARAWLGKAAEGGDARAQLRLAVLRLQDGDPGAAAPLAQAAADQGLADAQFLVGWMHHRGLGLPRDPEAARAWLAAAASSGSRIGQAALAQTYALDESFEVQAEGAQWLRMAAAAGFPHAQYDLALLHIAGRGVEQDLDEAIRWLRAAAAQGLPEALGRLGIMGESVEDVAVSR